MSYSVTSNGAVSRVWPTIWLSFGIVFVGTFCFAFAFVHNAIQDQHIFKDVAAVKADSIANCKTKAS
jgi:hypothetical protein